MLDTRYSIHAAALTSFANADNDEVMVLPSCHPDRGPERPEWRDLWKGKGCSVVHSPQIPRLASLARDDIPTGLPRSARRHAICVICGQIEMAPKEGMSQESSAQSFTFPGLL